MEYKSGTDGYYRQMLELQDRLRKSEEERLKLEQNFNEIMQHSRDAEHERLRLMRHKYHKFLEEDKVRQERNENILRTLDRIESRAKQLAAKTDRFKAFRKQYFENYLKQIPKQKQQTFELNTQSINRPQYQNESVRRKLFTDQPSTKQNENVETKLALLEQYLRDNFDNFPRDFPASNITKQNGIYDGKQINDLDDASDSKESQEIPIDRYSPSKMNGHQKANEILGNRIEQELDRLRNNKEKELNNNSLDVQEINPEQVISDYKKLVSKSEEKYGLKNGLQNGIAKNTENAQIDEANKSHKDISLDHFNEKENINLNLLEDEENSEDTKPPTDISLNLSSPSQLKEQFDESKQDEMETLPQIKNEEILEQSSISEEITSIEKQKVQPADLQFDKIPKTSEISEPENINNQHYIEEIQSNEFGESVYNQQYSQEQKYPPEGYSEKYQELNQPEYLEQYAAPQGTQNDSQEQPKYKQDYENAPLQDDNEEVYNEGKYVNPEEQYASPNQQYKNSGYKNAAPEKQFPQSEQQFETPKQQYKAPEQQYETPEQQYEPSGQYVNPEEQYVDPAKQQFVNPEKQQYVNPEQEQYVNPEQEQYVNPEQEQYVKPEQQYVKPEQEQYVKPEQQYVKPEQEQYVNPEQQQYINAEQPYINPEQEQYVNPEQQQYINPEQQYINPEQEQYVNPEQQQYVNSEQEQYVNPEQQQYVNPEQQQYVSPEQQQYPTDNYDQQRYPEGEYDPQNYPQVYDTQQPENYPQQQYPEGYDPQQYTEEQQLEYDQQYPQGEGYQEQQFVENTGEYDPQAQYPENLYQTGQEYLEGEQNVDLQYESEQQQNYPGQEIEQTILEGQVNETVMEGEDISVVSEEQKQLDDTKPLVQKKLPNLADMLDTDTSESVKPDNKVSDSDFDFSNTKT